MPHLPDSQHPEHDLELIAAYAAGDATGPDLERATAQVAACDECAALHHDLRSIAAAMPELPAPARTRDFTLTPEQAATLRPTGIRGLLATLSGPRFSFATPVGTGLAALGIVGVLVASGGGLPASGGTAAPQPETAVTLEAPAEGPSAAAASAAASAAPEAQGVYAAGRAARRRVRVAWVRHVRRVRPGAERRVAQGRDGAGARADRPPPTSRSRPSRWRATARHRTRGSGSHSSSCSQAPRWSRRASSRVASHARPEPREPIRRRCRQGPEMPHLPDSQHPEHDLELIAAYAAGDATGPDLERATAQVAACDECAALHHDLRSIAAAMPELPAPARTRDFTLTPEQAATLRPTGIRGLLATLSGPRFSFATPVGTGLAALGIVGVLVASAAACPRAVARPRPSPRAAVTQNDQPAGDAAGARAWPPKPPRPRHPRRPRRPPPRRPRPSSMAAVARRRRGIAGVDTMGGGEEPNASEPAAAASEAPASAGTGTDLYMSAAPSGDPSRSSGVALDPAESPDTIQAITAPTAPAATSSAWLPAAVLLLALGAALVLVRWGARRLA